jgi:integrase
MVTDSFRDGSVYIRESDKRAVAVLYVEGRKRPKEFYGATKAEARKKREAAKMQLMKGKLVTSSKQCTADFLNQWLRDVAQHRVKLQTYDSYQKRINHVLPVLGDVRLDRLTTAHVQNFYAQLLEQNYSPTTVNDIHRVLVMALDVAVRWSLLPDNPARYAEPPRREKAKITPLTPQQLNTLLDATQGTRWHALWALLGTCGLRISEALALRWNDIKNNHVVIDETLYMRSSEEGRVAIFTNPKSDASAAVVELTPEAKTALARHRVIQNEMRLAAGPDWQNEGDLVFTTQEGRPLSRRTVGSKYLRRDLKNNGLPVVGAHQLRHTAATIALEGDVHPKLVQEMLRHSSYNTTMNIYSHVVPSMHARAATRIHEVLQNARTIREPVVSAADGA